MAVAYAKPDTLQSVQNTLILAVKESLFIPHGFINWTELRVGLFVSATAVNQSNQGNIIEDEMTWVDPTSTFVFGLNADASSLPGQAGNYYCGLSGMFTTNPNYTGFLWEGEPMNQFTVVIHNTPGLYYITGINGVNSYVYPTTSRDFVTANTQGNPIGYAGFCGLRYTVANANQSNQSISLWSQAIGNYAQALSQANMSAQLLGMNPSSMNRKGSLPWNAAGTALPLPGYITVRWPFPHSQLRICGWGAMQIS